MRLKQITLALCGLLCAAAGWADPLDKIADKLEKKLADKSGARIAVLAFPYHDGAISSGSSIVQEELTTRLAKSGKLDIIERNLIKTIMQEKKLELSGIIDPATTKELGKILGAGILVTGTLTDLKKDKTEINARAVDAETGRILAAESAKIERTWQDAPVQPVQVGPAQPNQPAQTNALGKPLVQLAILLDTSNSMDGLISQAKNQLWQIANTFTSSEQKGKGPEIQVALYEYGNSGLSVKNGYIRKVLDFTPDMDKVSQELFALRTNGGDEYCGQVIDNAVRDLRWDKHSDVYRAIFIAGNEPFTQGPVDFRQSAAKAAEKGIFINTIFCGDRQQGMATGWKEGATLAGGDYSNIDSNIQIAAVSAPQDAEIETLTRQLDDTYIPYGEKGAEGAKLKESQDMAVAGASPEAAMQRSMFKATAQRASADAKWDVVSALDTNSMTYGAIDKNKLPENLQKMSAAERKQYIDGKLAQRRKTAQAIQSLQKARETYIEKHRAQTAAPTFGEAVLRQVKTQAKTKGFSFGK